MEPIKVALLNKVDVAQGTTSFYFEKPQGFNYTAGQYINLKLLNAIETDEKGDRRFFSLASAPYQDKLMITSRMRDTAFKRTLSKMQIGEKIDLFGPYGSLVLEQSSDPVVFLVGGIGITPFLSMILQATHDNLPNKIYLFYSNRRPEDTAFLEELDTCKDKNPNFTLIATMTDMEKSEKSWNGDTGYITKQMLEKYLEDLEQFIYYSAGPPVMVATMKKLLIDAGIDEAKIKTEDFSGY